MKMNARTILVTLSTFGLFLGSVGVAEARSASTQTTFPNGIQLTSNSWIDTFSDSQGCGDYQSSAVIGARPVWIKNTVSFHANGIGASVSGVSLSGGGADASATWTNSNGTLGSYLSGRVCANWLTVYLSMSSTGSAFYYGSVRTATSAL